MPVKIVTILILIDGFLQYENNNNKTPKNSCHNPYFNRWFSAMIDIDQEEYIQKVVTILILIDGFLQ